MAGEQTHGDEAAAGIGTIDEYLLICTLKARVLLDMRPLHDAVTIDQKVRAIREESRLVEDAVAHRDLTLEVAEEVDLHAVLLLVLLERISGINADGEN